MSKYSLTASIRLQHDQKSLQQLRSTAEKSLSGLNVSLNTRSINAFTKQLQEADKAGSHLARSVAEISAQAKTMGKGLDVIGKSIYTNGKNGSNGFGMVTDASKKAKDELNKLLNVSNKLTTGHNGQSTAVQKLATSYGNIITSSIAVYGAFAKVNDAVRENIKLMEESVNLGQIRGQQLGSTDIKGLTQQSRSLSEKYGTSGGPSKLLGAYAQLEQAGIAKPELMETLAKLSLNKQVEDLTTISDLMIVINRSWGIKSKAEVESYFSKLIKASQDSKASVESLADGSSILNNVVNQLGGSYESIFALLAKGEDITGRSSTEIARGMNTIFSNMLTKQDLAGKLKGYGVDLFKFDEKTGTKQFDDPIKNLRKLKNLIDQLGGPNSLSGSAMVEEISGVRRSPILAGIFAALDQIESYEGALQRNIADPINSGVVVALDSVQTKLNQLSTTFTNTIGKILDSKGFTTFASTILTASNAVLKLVDAFAELVPLMGAIALGKLSAGKLANIPLIGGAASQPRFNMPKYNQFSKTPTLLEQDKLVDIIKTEIQEKYKGISAQRAEQYAIVETVDQLKKGVRVYTNMNGVVEKVTRSQQRWINATSAAKSIGQFAKRNAVGIGALGVAGVSEFAGDTKAGSAIASGGAVGLSAYAMGVHPLIAILGGAVLALKSFTSQVKASTGVMEQQQMEAARSRQAAKEAVGATNSKEYAADIIDRYKTQLSMETSKGQDATWGNMFGAIYSYVTGGGDVSGAQLRSADMKKAAEGTRAGSVSTIEEDVKAIARIYGYTSAEEFSKGAGAEITALGTIVSEDFPTKLNEIFKSIVTENAKTVAEVNRRVIQSPKTDMVRQQYLRNKDASGLSHIGTSAFSEAVDQLPNNFDKANLTAINKIKQILPNVLKDGFAKEEMIPAVSKALQEAGLAEGIVQVITNELQSTDLEAVGTSFGALNTLTDDIIKTGFPGLLEGSIEARDSLLAFADELSSQMTRFVEQGLKSAELNSAYYKSQMEIKKTLIGFAGGSVMGMAGMGNRIAQQQAMDIAGTADANELGRRIMALQGQLEANKNNTFRTNGIQTTIDSLKQALQVLGNTADRTGDIFAALNEQEQKDLSRKNFILGYMKSDFKGRMEMARGMAVTSQVASGKADFAKLPINLQQQVIATLEGLGTAPFAGSGGMGADKVLDALLSKISGIDFVKGSPEKQALQQQIINTMQDASNAMWQSAIVEQQRMNDLFNGLHNENKWFIAELTKIMAPPKVSTTKPDPYEWVGSGGKAKTINNIVPMEALNQFGNMMTNVSRTIENSAKMLNGLSLSHTFNGKLEVLINGGMVLNQMMPTVREYVEKEITKALQNLMSKQFGLPYRPV